MGEGFESVRILEMRVEGRTSGVAFILRELDTVVEALFGRLFVESVFRVISCPRVEVEDG